jgi:vanillate O-demethylase monooxygenase subunit
VPTQPKVPLGARVGSFPVVEQDGLVWVWVGTASPAGRRHPPRTPWLADPAWTTFGDQWVTEANVLLLHENFADITHVAVVDPYIAPPVLRAEPPGLEVEVSEAAVSFSRDYPPAPIAGWHADVLGLPAEAEHAQREEGAFVSPGLWVDAWHVMAGTARHTFRFTHAVTPVSPSQTRHVWRVSRNFAPGEAISERLQPIFTAYYHRVQEILQTMQRVIEVDGERDEVSVNSDAAALQVRKIISRLVAEEQR